MLLPDGLPLIKTGVVPAIVVHPTVDDVRQGRDPGLERAVQELKRARMPAR